MATNYSSATDATQWQVLLPRTMLFKLLLYAENAMFGSQGLARAQKDATRRGSMEDTEPGDNGIPHQMNADEVLALIAEAADEPPAPIAQQEQPAAKKTDVRALRQTVQHVQAHDVQVGRRGCHLEQCATCHDA